MRGIRTLIVVAGVALGLVACQPSSDCGRVLTRDTTLRADVSNCPGDGLVVGAEDITGIVVTDTVPIDPRERPDNLTVLTVAPLLAETIMNVFSDDSVSAIFGGETQLF